MRTRSNIFRHELIGLLAQVIEAKNKANLGIKGKIVDETHHTLVIEQNGKEKQIFKKCVKLELNLPSGEKIIIDGKKIDGKPWERIRKKL